MGPSPTHWLCVACHSHAETIRHIVAEFEAQFGGPDAASAADNWLWIVDLRGFSIFGSNILGLGREFVNVRGGSHAPPIATPHISHADAQSTPQVFTRHFPERLGTMLLVDAPYLVSGAYRALVPFMDPATVRKVSTISQAEALEVVEAVVPGADQREWLRAALTMEPKPGVLPAKLPASAPEPTHIAIPRLRAAGLATPASSVSDSTGTPTPAAGGAGAVASPVADDAGAGGRTPAVTAAELGVGGAGAVAAAAPASA